MTFFCSRCGARLQAPDELVDARVRCAGCNTVARTPEAVGETADEELPPTQIAPLDYATPFRHLRTQLSFDDLAEKLANIEVADDNSESSMIDCPYCDSRIASFVRKCPYCRHPLHGP
jgi:DNA-directed RNA polymerase subunit RPC12/RpoP